MIEPLTAEEMAAVIDLSVRFHVPRETVLRLLEEAGWDRDEVFDRLMFEAAHGDDA